jgi:hypothetical protein
MGCLRCGRSLQTDLEDLTCSLKARRLQTNLLHVGILTITTLTMKAEKITSIGTLAVMMETLDQQEIGIIGHIQMGMGIPLLTAVVLTTILPMLVM